MRELLSAIEERMTSPTARGLADAVSRAIRDGVLEPGTKLPPIRRVATELALSPTTVSAGWTLLTRTGALHTDGRRGTTVADGTTPGAVRYRTALRRRAPFDLDLSTGVPDAALLPSLDRALSRLDTAGTPSSYLDDPVLPELLDVLRSQWPYPAEHLTVVDGAMDALDQVTRTVLRFGDTVVLEHPCFPALADLMEASGIDVVGVPVDEHGLVPGDLAQALSRPVAAVFLQPRAHNPTGASMTPERAAELAGVVAGAGALVVEDDSAGAIAGTEPVSLGRWLPERTVHIRSFSKSHGPDLRLAALSAPPDVMQHLQARRQLGQGWSSRLLQRVLHGLLVDRATIAEIAAAQVTYASRRHRLVAALAELGVGVAAGDGINLWLPVHDEAAALAALSDRGIGAAPGSPFMVLAHGSHAGHLRVTCGLVPDSAAVADRVADALAVAAAARGRL